jgi:hypothetical protein
LTQYGRTQMEWSKLLGTKVWTPLCQVCECARNIEGDLFQLGENQFARALSHDATFCDGLPNAPFVTIVYWAETIVAMKRCVLMDDTVHVEQKGIAPSELLFGTRGTYGEFLKSKEFNRIRRGLVTAIYSGKNGKFIHKSLSNGTVAYLFLDRDVYDDETPYAIEFRLH